MGFPDNFERPEDELEEDPKEREEYREAWFEIQEDEEVSEDEISAADTREGGGSMPDPFDEDVLGDGIDEMMHEEDAD
jgi:hypothetical protein